jgi:putative ABC transport system ATP-binding protein
MTLIQLKDICKVYKLGEVEVHALAGISMHVEQGEYLALMGSSGSGKSTLMNTLGCIDRPSSGSYLLNGEEVVSMTLEERARLRNQKIGFVFQNFNLLSRTSALENVELPMMYAHRMKWRRRREHAAMLLEKVGLVARADHFPSQLSGGEQQRVAIARALANDPSILLADEPTGNLDSRTSREVMELLEHLNKDDKITIILVTHDQEVARWAQRKVILRDGYIVSDSMNDAAGKPDADGHGALRGADAEHDRLAGPHVDKQGQYSYVI